MINYIQETLSSSFLQAVGWAVVHSIWQILLLSLALKVVLLKTGKSAPNSAYNWGLAALFIALGAFVTTFLYHYNHLSAAKVIMPATVELFVTNTTGGMDPIAPEARSTQFLPVISSVWLVGVCILSIRLFSQFLMTFWYRHNSKSLKSPFFDKMLVKAKHALRLTQSVDLRVSNKVDTPLTLGFLKPLVLFPAALINQLTVEEIESILFHELTHIKRNDFLAGLIQSVMEILFFYHPAFWWMSQQVNNCREQVCDDFALRHANKLVYSKALMKIAGFQLAQSPKLALSASGNNKKVLYHRIERILSHQKKESGNAGAWMIPFLLFALLTLSFSPWAKDNPSPNFEKAYLSATNDWSESSDLTCEGEEEGLVNNSPVSRAWSPNPLPRHPNQTIARGSVQKAIASDEYPKKSPQHLTQWKSNPIKERLENTEKNPLKADFNRFGLSNATFQNDFVYTIKQARLDTLVPPQSNDELRAELERLKEELEQQRQAMQEQQRIMMEEQQALMEEMHSMRRIQMEHRMDSIIDRYEVEMDERHDARFHAREAEAIRRAHEEEKRAHEQEFEMERREALERQREAMAELRKAKQEEREEYRRHQEELRLERNRLRAEERKMRQNGWDKLLLEYGFIDQIDGPYKMMLNNKQLRINGKKQSDELHHRFLEYYEQNTGGNVNKNFTVTIAKT